ncbi:MULTISPECIES: glycosyltransferase [Commensalibacter]|uniref:Uncharacterized protein n=2 Tax=Commensalibacter TaxID=1079922 RepID=W7DTU4_9PROT|nr:MULTISPECIES: glycosyltransferase [Commensalibacter]EUK18420.1 hypothetical protein COMX_01690 [Commensalibacter papalotli (ex Servin-Garciduenas et al. 2014)]CAI3934001.1 unnamed protein product [Commensalibacter papalotli (ex Botero et al. 2024)]CAI3941693.1 unnamed protein product [Commensalibacter papalotli (ex Botero et al. 2024)]
MQHAQEWFDYILSSQWVELGNNNLIQPQRNADGIWTLGKITVCDQDILNACPSSDISNLQEFHILHDSWKAASFKIYRPLIYFCAFGKNEIFECVYTAIQSLIEFGHWQHDIAILTSEDKKDDFQLLLLLASLNLKKRLHLIIVPASEKIDWYISRYRIDHPIFKKAQPILYLDTDIMCDAPLDELLISLINSPLIHACKEGVIDEGGPETSGYWYGWRLMQEDHVPFNPKGFGFSSGVLLFNNTKTTQPFFDMIRRSTNGFIQKNGYNGVSYDQRFANYILLKFKQVEINILEKWVYLYRIPQQTTLTPSGNNKRGLVHFLNSSTENKLITMKKYLNDLRFRAKYNN